jgi:hypothetical protein
MDGGIWMAVTKCRMWNMFVLCVTYLRYVRIEQTPVPSDTVKYWITN